MRTEKKEREDAEGVRAWRELGRGEEGELGHQGERRGKKARGREREPKERGRISFYFSFLFLFLNLFSFVSKIVLILKTNQKQTKFYF
jgi:hypothetical protein